MFRLQGSATSKGLIPVICHKENSADVSARPAAAIKLCKPAKMDSFLAPDRRTFLDMARLSQLAYSTPDVMTSIWKAGKAHPTAFAGTPSEVVCRLVYEPKYFNAPTVDAQCYQLVYEQVPGVSAWKLPSVKQAPVLVLDFRGTSDLADAMCDINLQQVPFLDVSKDAIGKVHSGFNKQFRGILPLVDKAVQAYLQTGNSLLCVGHSLGSGLAVLAAAYMPRAIRGSVAFWGLGLLGWETLRSRLPLTRQCSRATGSRMELISCVCYLIS